MIQRSWNAWEISFSSRFMAGFSCSWLNIIGTWTFKNSKRTCFTNFIRERRLLSKKLADQKTVRCESNPKKKFVPGKHSSSKESPPWRQVICKSTPPRITIVDYDHIEHVPTNLWRMSMVISSDVNHHSQQTAWLNISPSKSSYTITAKDHQVLYTFL